MLLTVVMLFGVDDVNDDYGQFFWVVVYIKFLFELMLKETNSCLIKF